MHRLRGVFTAGISLAIIAVVNGLGSNLNGKFSTINTALKQVAVSRRAKRPRYYRGLFVVVNKLTPIPAIGNYIV